MTTDNLQKFIFNQIQHLKSLEKLSTNKDPEYLRALKDMATKLEQDRDEIIKAHAKLKEIGLIL